MGWEELWDGEEHWLGVDAAPGWVVPEFVTVDIVKVVGDHDPLESPDPNLVVDRIGVDGNGFWTQESGWAAFAVMAQALAELLEVPVVVEQVNARSADGVLKSKHYMFKVGSASPLFDDADSSADVDLSVLKGL